MAFYSKKFEYRMLVKKTIVKISPTGRQKLKRKPLVLFMVSPEGDMAGFMDSSGQVYLYTLEDFNSTIDITNRNGKVKHIQSFSIITRNVANYSKEIKEWIANKDNARKYRTWYISEKTTIALAYKKHAILQILLRRPR